MDLARRDGIIAETSSGSGGEQRFVAIDMIADVLHPFSDCSFRDGLAHLRHYDFSSHDDSNSEISNFKSQFQSDQSLILQPKLDRSP